MSLKTKNINHLTVHSIAQVVNGTISGAPVDTEQKIEYAFASDLMSDVLMLDTNDITLITGLANPQVIRTAEMSDINLVIIARDKKCSSEMINLARENNITIIETPYSVFKVSGLLYNQGIKPIF
ncbi:MAG: hypothetical protein K9I29_04350 [Bacteroidales bacterium]|nr:hypothetical protein [Bacteroidales bacterium]MCF8327504.1 hypothetical protein [Bacteroidales bacterium]